MKTTTAPTGPLLVTVNVIGGQPQIDMCKGPVLVPDQNIIAQHDGCGGNSFKSLTLGSSITLAGSAVANGNYRVTSIQTFPIGATNYPEPSTYALQTCVGGSLVHLWYLSRA